MENAFKLDCDIENAQLKLNQSIKAVQHSLDE
jgi:hypothetical protein